MEPIKTGENGADGRDPGTGRFVAGNPGGPGRPRAIDFRKVVEPALELILEDAVLLHQVGDDLGLITGDPAQRLQVQAVDVDLLPPRSHDVLVHVGVDRLLPVLAAADGEPPAGFAFPEIFNGVRKRADVLRLVEHDVRLVRFTSGEWKTGISALLRYWDRDMDGRWSRKELNIAAK